MTSPFGGRLRSPGAAARKVRADRTCNPSRLPIATGITAPETLAGAPSLSGQTAVTALCHRLNGVNGGASTDGNGINGQPTNQKRPRSNGVNGRLLRPSASCLIGREVVPVSWRSTHAGAAWEFSYNYRAGHHGIQTGAAFSHQLT